MQAKLLALGAGLALTLAGAAALADSGTVTVADAWARATPGGAQAGAAYVTLESPTGDRLTGVSTPVAQQAELHSMTMDGGVMRMRQVDGIDLPAGQAVTLKPGGYHIMLTGLSRPLEEGQSLRLTLTFAKAGRREVSATVRKIGAMGPGGPAGDNAAMPGMTMPTHR